MTMLPSIKTTVRAAVIGLVLTGTTLTAMPAAQAAPSFSFSFNIGGDRFTQRDCLSDRQVRRLLRWQGYDEIRFTDRRGKIVTVRAEKGRHDYRVTVNACTGRIIDIDRLRRR
jgi:hypothetical protein